MRKPNPLALAILVVASTVLGAASYLAHDYQLRRNASSLLLQVDQAAAGGDAKRAIKLMTWYLSLIPDDPASWVKYSEMVEAAHPPGTDRTEAFLVCERALLRNPGDLALVRRCADLGLDSGVNRPGDALRHASLLLEKAGEAGKQGPALAELEELRGRANLAASHFSEAEQDLAKAIADDSTRFTSYSLLAGLLRNNLRKPQDADQLMDDMVKANAGVGRAYVVRYRYDSEFRRPPRPDDLKSALDRSPEDPEVLLVAGIAAEQARDIGAARAHLEKGRRLDPQNLEVLISLARLQMRSNQIADAEATLRQAYQAQPHSELALWLADALILDNKIEGPECADEFIEVLRSRGLGETYVRYLEGRIEVQRRNWELAAKKLEAAAAVLKADPRISAQIDLALAECYEKLGRPEQRLTALGRAAETGLGGDETRLAFARALTEAGDVSQALSILAPLADTHPEVRLDVARLTLADALRKPPEKRDWKSVEQRLAAAEKEAQPRSAEALCVLRAEMLAAMGQRDEARSVLVTAQAREPGNPKYAVALARLSEGEHRGAEALGVLDRAEKERGPSLEITLARLEHWVQQGDAQAKVAIREIAEARDLLPPADRPALLDQLARGYLRLGEPTLARRYWLELSDLKPANISLLSALFDLALEAGKADECQELVRKIREVEGELGTNWRFALALQKIDQASRGDRQSLQAARSLAAETSSLRPTWWGASVLNARIAEIENQPEAALAGYREAVNLGNSQPWVIRRLLRSLYQANQFDELDRLAQALRERQIASPELTVVSAIEATRRGDHSKGLELARQVIPDSSTSSSDHLALAGFHAAAGQSAEAARHFRLAVEIAPGLPEAWLSLVQHLVQTKQTDQARSAAAAARKALPDDQATVAVCLMMVGDTTQAEAVVQTALRDKPTDGACLRIAAGLCLARNRPDEVGKYVDALVAPDRNPTDEDRAWANHTRATLMVRSGRSDDAELALELLDQNRKYHIDSDEDARLRATILARRPGRIDQAIKILEPLARASKLPPGERFLLAQLYLSQGNEVQYQSEMLRVQEAADRSPSHLAHFTSYLIERGRLADADRWLSALAQLEPLGRRTLELQAARLKALGRQSDVLNLLVTRGREAPEQLGLVADLLGRYGFVKEAENTYRRYCTSDPSQPVRLLELARFLAGEDRVGEAMKLLSEASKTCRLDQVAAVALDLYDAKSIDGTHRNQIDAWITEAVQKHPEADLLASKLALLRMRQERYDEAEALLRQTVASHPDNTDALNNLAWLLVMREQAQPEEALRLVTRAIDLRGHTTLLVDTLAVVLIRDGKLDRAIAELTDARRRDPSNPGLAFHLAWALEAKGMNEEARKELLTAQQLGLRAEVLDAYERSIIKRLKEELSPC
jgi:predicted Zn-dependent protease